MRGLWKDLAKFLWKEKKWWAIPLLIVGAALVALFIYTQGPAPLSPFMYQNK